MKKMLVLLTVIIAVSMVFVASGVVRAQGSDEEGKWPIYAITYGKGIILTSPDSDTWTVRTSGTDVPLAAIAYGNGTFVAVGGRGEHADYRRGRLQVRLRG
jgi:hypothetical protein